MNKKIVLLLVALAMLLLLGGATLLYDNLSEKQKPQQLVTNDQAGDTDHAHGDNTTVAAPDFTVYDDQGNPVQLSDFFGKPIVLNFWASWCGPCQQEMPDFEEKYKELDGKVQFLMINMTAGRETLETAQSFIRDKGYTFPVYFDTQVSAATAYNAYSLPTTYLINAEGQIVAQAMGAISGDVLQQGIDMIYP